MRRCIPVALVIPGALMLGACGEPAEMPQVEGQRLDVALSDIERAGYDDEPEIIGGGTFGVLDESNWYVCNQDPAEGELIEETPRLTVDRECVTTPQSLAESPQGSTVDHSPGQTGSDTFVVPAMVGMDLQTAQDTLQSLGSYMLTQTDASGLERFQVLDANWKVCMQAPRAGAVVPLETLVDLGVVKDTEICP